MLGQLTGQTPSSVTTENSCAPPSPGTASCTAQLLVLRSNHGLVRPHVGARRSFSQVFGRGDRALAAPATPQDASAAQNAPPPGTPGYVQQAYDLAYLSETAGSGDTIAIVDAYDDPTAEQDLAVYRSQFGLPPCTTANGCFAKLGQNGSTTNLPPASPPSDDWESEISLDLDAVSAICPNCHIKLIEANSESYTNLLAAETVAVGTGAKQISNSWGGGTALDAGHFTHSGVAFVAATGDHGYEAVPDYPAALPGVTAAGGTALTTASNAAGGRGYSESAWSLDDTGWGGGTGCNTHVTQPAYQTTPGCNGRAMADLSADGDPATGLAVYDSGNGGWLVIGGTSLASPLIAAYYAVTGIDASSPGWAYAKSSLLNDPVSGSAGTCAPNLTYICNAGSGYDGPTGVGSISGDIVSGAPGVGGPSAGTRSAGGYVASVDASSATLAGGVYPNGNDTTYWWQYGATTAYGQQTLPTDLGSGSAPVPTTDTLSGLVAGTTYHYRLVAQNSAGTTYGYDYEFTTASAGTTSTAPVQPGDVVLYNVRAPSITGSAREGQTLTASAGEWVGNPKSIRYQWRSCDYAGVGCASIAGATGNAHRLTHADVGRTLYVVVTAANGGGSATAISRSTSVVSVASPPRVSSPKLSSTSVRTGKPLAVTLTLSASATVSVAITTRVAGRRIGGRCAANAKRGRRCTATVHHGSLSFSGPSGRHTFALHLPRLSPGRYTATVTARGSGGTSNRLTFTFKIVR